MSETALCEACGKLVSDHYDYSLQGGGYTPCIEQIIGTISYGVMTGEIL